MKPVLDLICPCASPLSPFVLAVAVDGVLTYLAWWGLGLLPLGALQRLSAALAVFLVLGGLLLFLALGCLQRCQEERLKAQERSE